MPDYLLYQSPGSCSRVALAALEEIGIPYREAGVALLVGEQREPAFQAINPKGKVPVLIADGVTVTELPAILYLLANAHPAVRLLPANADGVAELGALSDLIWFAGAMHRLTNLIFRPAAVSPADPEGVKAGAISIMAAEAKKIATRLADQEWWYGDRWSIVDTYLSWHFWVARAAGFPLDDHPVLVEHMARVEARPSHIRALERERASVARDRPPLPPVFTI